MFETVVPETFHRRSRRVFYETLPVSIALHVAGVGTAVTMTLWNVVFPTHYPHLIAAYSLTAIPDPPPPPPPPPVAKPRLIAPKEELKPPPPAPMTQLVAPTIIPDTIPQIVEAPPAPPPPPAAVPVSNPIPSTAGSEHGVAGGEIGGTGKLHGIAGGIILGEDGRVHLDRKSKLPLKVIEQGFPHYPEDARKNRLDDTVVVRYTIGKNGRVIDLDIIEHAKQAMFDEETVSTIRKWRFRPMIVNGIPVEVVHEVEVFYQFYDR